jgi:SAM-dependent methyltransferase
MATENVYLRQTLESPNPLSRFAHKARHGVALDIASKQLKQGGTLLDYGCGPGMFLSKLAAQRPDARLFGHDIRPTVKSTAQFTFIPDTRTIADQSIDIVTSFDVLEHMFDDEREALWAEVKRVLAPGGHFIVSVPVIGGPVLLLKEANKTFFYKKTKYQKYTLKELMLAAFLGVPAKRPDGVRETHKGFDFRALERSIRRNFRMDGKHYSPFGALPWFLNSQVFFDAMPLDGERPA